MKYFVLIIIAGLLACTPIKEKRAEKLAKKAIYPSEILKISDEFKTVQGTLKFDNELLADTSENLSLYKLNVEQVNFLSSELAKDKLSEINSYYIKDFNTIEASKKAKKYHDYVLKLDIGMMKDINCYTLNKVELNDSTAVLFWKINYKSFEACPYYFGTHIMASVVSAGKLIQTIQVAAKESSIDPPMSNEVYQVANYLGKGVLKTKYTSITKESDSEMERIEERFNYQISSAGFIKK